MSDAVVRDIEVVDEILRAKDSTREYLIRVSRDVVRNSGLAIAYIHLGKLDEAEGLLSEVKRVVEDLEVRLEPHPELKYSNLYLSALSEYIEAVELLSLVRTGRLKTLSELKLHYLPYIQGLLDLVGELKKYSLNLVRLDDIEGAWTYFNIASSIYESLKTLNYPEALVPGVRRKIDVSRKVLEDLRGFLVDVESRSRLVKALSTKAAST